jgi:hypothetical protein
MTTADTDEDYLARLGQRVRAARKALKFSRKWRASGFFETSGCG